MNFHISRSSFRFFIIFLFWVNISLLSVQIVNGQSKKQINDKNIEIVFARISKYEFDKSRSWLNDFRMIMEQAYKVEETRSQVEDKMVEILKSDATWAGKQFICKHIGTIGTSKSVPVLSKMLKQDKTGIIALRALEPIPDPFAGKALRNALDETEGDVRIGIINALGERREEKATEQLTRILKEENHPFMEPTLAALGKIGTKNACKSLKNAFLSYKGNQKWEAAEAYLNCIDLIYQKKELPYARKAYKQVYQAQPPLAIRRAAILGLFKTRDHSAKTFIINHLQQSPPEMHPEIISLIRKIPDPENFAEIFQQIPKLPENSKMHLIVTLAECGDSSVHDYIIRACEHENEVIRHAALNALVHSGNEEDVLYLAEMAAEKKGTERKLARQTLYNLQGKDIDRAIISYTDKTESTIQHELLKSIGERHISSGIDILIKYGDDKNPKTRIIALETLADVASPEDVPEMIDLLIKTQSKNEKREIQNAIYRTTLRYDNSEQVSRMITNALSSVDDEATMTSLISILGKTGKSSELSVLSKYLYSENQTVRIAAIKALSDWPNASPAKDFKNIMQDTEDLKTHTLAMRGLVKIVQQDNSLSGDQKFDYLQETYRLTKNKQQKRTVISSLSQTESLGALKLMVELLSREELKPEVQAAIINLANSLAGQYPVQVTTQVEKAATISEDQAFKEKLDEILQETGTKH